MSSTATELDAPNSARRYDYLLGGREHLGRDRDMMDALACVHRAAGAPSPREMSVANRVYLQRAVSQAAHSRARQFLDLGAGFPCPEVKVPCAPPLRQLHAEAQAAAEGARFVYVDKDPLVISHGLAALAREGARGVTYAHLDLADVPSVRRCPDVTGTALEPLIDFGQPLTVILGLVLNFCDASEARRIVAGYLDGLKPGSRVVITTARWKDPGLWEQAQAVYGPGRLWNHRPVQVAALFRGMSLLGNGVEEVQVPGGVVGRETAACVLAGTGLV